MTRREAVESTGTDASSWTPKNLLADGAAAIGEVLEHDELLVEIVRRDLLVRYKEAVVGVGWALLAPFLAMLVFSMVFARAAGVETNVPYPLFAYSGLLAWNLLASSLRSATTSLTGNRALVTKVGFPREILPISTVTVAFVDFLVACSVLAGLMLFYGVQPGWTIVLLPVVVVVEIIFALGLALLLALGNLYFRDVGFVLGLALTLWMFTTSVVYPVELVGGRLGGFLLAANPMNPIIQAFRGALFGGALPDPVTFLGAVVIAVGVFAGGLVGFHRAEGRFAEVI